jgi:Tol biopolymer transport system component
MALTFLPARAGAAFPGENGKIAYTLEERLGDPPFHAQIAVIARDGSGQATLTSGAARNVRPRWSPDGRKITFCSDRGGNDDVYVMNADGSNLVQLTASPASDCVYAWSPDGSKIAFASNRDGNGEVYVMNADGSNEVRLTNNSALDHSPTWSPDSGRLAFTRHDESTFPPVTDVYAVNVDGSSLTRLTDPQATDDAAPAWSPDGATIAFLSRGRGSFGSWNIWTMNPDGSGKQQITPNHSESHLFREWAPVGGRIMFHFGTDTYTANRDGTDVHRLTDDPAVRDLERWSPDAGYVTGTTQSCPDPELPCDPPQLFVMRSDGSGITDIGPGEDPDWQPIPVNSYPRPKSAPEIRVPLVPAYGACDPSSGHANRTHGPPLAYPSCAPPVHRSAELTIGTVDSNGYAASSQGHVRIRPVDADVAYELELLDVRKVGDGSDYGGELRLEIATQITDRDNTPSPAPSGAATMKSTVLSVTAPCTTTPDRAAIGSTCQVSTTADALVPGTVKQGKRGVWEFGKVRVFDGGPDGDAETAPNTLFAAQGIFVP